MRDAIVKSFAIGKGEKVLGEIVERRQVHSVNSLRAATGLNPLRLYTLMQKARMIPANSDAEALNQWVFPAEEGERLIGRIVNSIPQNKIKEIIGCNRGQAEKIVGASMVTSVVPTTAGDVGLSVGAYNREDLQEFLALICANTSEVSAAPPGHVSLEAAARWCSSTVEILRWQIDGKLRNTKRVGPRHRIDNLRFELEELRALIRDKPGNDLVPLRKVVRRTGLSREVVKRLVNGEGVKPLLALAPPQQYGQRRGTAYVSITELDRFMANYLTLSRAAELLEVTPQRSKAMLDGVVAPVRDPDALGARIYRRRDIEKLVTRSRAQTA